MQNKRPGTSATNFRKYFKCNELCRLAELGELRIRGTELRIKRKDNEAAI